MCFLGGIARLHNLRARTCQDRISAGKALCREEREMVAAAFKAQLTKEATVHGRGACFWTGDFEWYSRQRTPQTGDTKRWFR